MQSYEKDKKNRMKVEYNEIRSVYINENTSSKDMQFEWKLNLNTREFQRAKNECLQIELPDSLEDMSQALESNKSLRLREDGQMRELSVHEIGTMDEKNLFSGLKSKGSQEYISRKQSGEQISVRDSRAPKADLKHNDLSGLLGHDDSGGKPFGQRSEAEEYGTRER